LYLDGVPLEISQIYVVMLERNPKGGEHRKRTDSGLLLRLLYLLLLLLLTLI
jgi:hypothetical protein